MFSFQKEAINYMTNGKVTVRGLAQLGLIPEGQCAIPNQFYESGWGIWLPMPNVTLLPFLSFCVANNYSKAEMIRFLEQKIKPGTFIDFQEKSSKGSQYDDEYELLYTREIEVKRRLEANGYPYPSNICDVVQLYIALGIACEEYDQDGNASIDLIIRPLNKVDEVLPIH
jgi:hypothetical protein